MRRRFGWEFNGMRLHEYYFGNLVNGGTELDESTEFFAKLTQSFGSYDRWEDEFKAVGAMRGIGWAILYYDPQAQRLLNVWINEHDLGHLAGATPILVMDVFEHAYMQDYGTNREEYIQSFLDAVHWEAVSHRFGFIPKELILT
jgi:superoxide dismutase, Fe-Mn family